MVIIVHFSILSLFLEIFEYRIENVSQLITGKELQKERQLHNQVINIHRSLILYVSTCKHFCLFL